MALMRSVAPVLSGARAHGGLAVAFMVCLTGQGFVAAGVEPDRDGAPPVEITECFQTVETDAVLSRDLVCEVHGLARAAIEIIASNVTVDLGGHALFGYPFGQLGIRAEGVDSVTVRNGTIDGFLIGLTFAEGSDLTVEDLTIRNLEIEDRDEWVIGVWINGRREVVVRDSSFEFLPVAHKSGVEAWSCSDCTIDTIASNGGALGVEINFGSTGEVVNSRFLGATIGGVLVEGSGGARIAHNEFVRNEVGIAAGGHDPDPISGLTVEANSFEDSFVGIRFQGITQSTVRDNVVRGRHWRGVALEPNFECQDPPGPECYYSTGNVITGNTVAGGYRDLYHDEACSPNTWERNICLTKEGDDIPSCTRLRWGSERRLEP